MTFPWQLCINHDTKKFSDRNTFNLCILYFYIQIIHMLTFWSKYHIMSFDTFNESLLQHSHCLTFSMSLFNFSLITCTSFPDINIFESSANRIEKHASDTDAKSLIYKRKSRSPSMDPWGTPHFISMFFSLKPIICYILRSPSQIIFKPL